MSEDRIKKFEVRRQQLEKMSDEQLKNRFWELCNQIVEPMVDYGKKYTSQSIERSVLLRMGIDSVTSQGVVSRINEAGLLGKGAGHVVLKVSQKHKVDLRAAAKRINEDKTALEGLF
ncbi:MAG: ornithine aminomutase [Candidatus Riflebacteria bacterium HGW-Riflebacteria-1]|jgi:D-ornithine 4,5-aminomutase subunit alpha|nr:MAG: ornithine aminomutase [Candidatus Riflebacteria bacterium HGW-Riflebacteria-1]